MTMGSLVASQGEIIKVKAHYNWSMYQALLNATKSSLKAGMDAVDAGSRGWTPEATLGTSGVSRQKKSLITI